MAAGLGLGSIVGCQGLRTDLAAPRPPEASSTETDAQATGTGTETATPAEAEAEDALAVSLANVEAPPTWLQRVSIQPPGDGGPYARFGASDADLTVTLVGSWKCAKTAAFIRGEFQRLVTEYVEPGRVAVEFRHVATTRDGPYLGPDGPKAGHAGLAVYHTAPEWYASYFGTVFTNRPPTHTTWATPAQLTTFAQHAGVEATDRIRQAVVTDRYAAALDRTTEYVYDLGIDGVPRVVVNGTVTAPRRDSSALFEALDTALEYERPDEN